MTTLPSIRRFASSLRLRFSFFFARSQRTSSVSPSLFRFSANTQRKSGETAMTSMFPSLPLFIFCFIIGFCLSFPKFFLGISGNERLSVAATALECSLARQGRESHPDSESYLKRETHKTEADADWLCQYARENSLTEQTSRP